MQARLEAAVILPHGDFAWDPTIVPDGGPARQAADAIAAAAHSAGQWLDRSIDPDLIFLSTPHGLSLTNDFAVYLNEAASGSVEIGADLRQNSSSYTVTLPSIALAPELARDLADQLFSRHENVTGMEMPLVTPLRWAEVIRLLLIPRRRPLLEQVTRSLRRNFYHYSNNVRQHLIWSYPLRRFDSAPAMVNELLRLGNWLGTWVESLPGTKVAVVVSGDLSHTHEGTGPYGFSTFSAEMDAALGSWAKDPCENAQDLLITAATLQNITLSCGFTGFVLLHGMLCGEDYGNSVTNVIHRRKWNSQVLVNRNVTYFGMMVARYSRI